MSDDLSVPIFSVSLYAFDHSLHFPLNHRYSVGGGEEEARELLGCMSSSSSEVIIVIHFHVLLNSNDV